MTKKKNLLISFLLVSAILVATEPTFSSLNKGVFLGWESSFLEPLFFVSISYFFSTVILLPFSNTIFHRWLKYIVSWFLPLSLIILTAASPTRGSVVSFDRTEYAIALGFVLTAMTLIFALVQRFYYYRT